MKKATTIIITSAALAFAIPLYAADGPDMKSDSQRQGSGVTPGQQGNTTRTGQMDQNRNETGQQGDATRSGQMDQNRTETGQEGDTSRTGKMDQNLTETGDRRDTTRTKQNGLTPKSTTEAETK